MSNVKIKAIELKPTTTEQKPVVSEVETKEKKNPEDKYAIDLEDVWFHFGWGKKKITVLQGINCKVRRGTIFGLLGPSGCGKTTLLRCILGRVRPSKGSVLVFGNPPGRGEEIKIPGSGVGYMPQELAIFMELTINESFRYFCRIHGLSKAKCAERSAFILDFLKLPSGRRLVRNLSGGQKRRVSFALALLTEPPLLVLDEPTVGVDPLLRINIWEHLVHLTNSSDVTVIITTHYVEEARLAHKVGLMRYGRMLAEDTPAKLMQDHNSNNLEDVFVTLCYKDKTSHTGNEEKRIPNASEKDEITDEDELYFDESAKRTESFYERAKATWLNRMRMNEMYSFPSFKRTKAVTIKNFIKMTRMWPFLLFQFILPSLQVILFCLAVGGTMSNLHVTYLTVDNGTYGNFFLENINKDLITLVPVDSIATGIRYVKEGKAWSTIFIGRNFTKDLISRFVDIKRRTPFTNIEVRLDLSNQQVALTIKKELFDTFIRFGQKVVKNITEARGALNLPIQVGWLDMIGMTLVTVGQLVMKTEKYNPFERIKVPIKFVEPIFGSEQTTFTEFMAPGIILIISFFMALGLTSMSFVTEKKEGLLERTYVAGVTTWEIMISHLITQFGVMVIQVVLMLFIILAVFNIPCEGPLVWVLTLTLLQGFCGMTYGILISTMCDQEMSAMVMSLATFYPSLLLSGVVWPAEAMPPVLYIMSNILPQRIPVESMRWLMGRGLDIDFYYVWIGFAVTIAWSFIFLLLAGIVLKLRGN